MIKNIAGFKYMFPVSTKSRSSPLIVQSLNFYKENEDVRTIQSVGDVIEFFVLSSSYKALLEELTELATKNGGGDNEEGRGGGGKEEER